MSLRHLWWVDTAAPPPPPPICHWLLPRLEALCVVHAGLVCVPHVLCCAGSLLLERPAVHFGLEDLTALAEYGAVCEWSEPLHRLLHRRFGGVDGCPFVAVSALLM